jgi:hypothetical protein
MTALFLPAGCILVNVQFGRFLRASNIDFVGLGDLGVLAVGQIVKLQEKTMGLPHSVANFV